MGDERERVDPMTGAVRMPSWMYAYLPAGPEALGVTEISERLRKGIPGLIGCEPRNEAGGLVTRWRLEAKVRRDDREVLYGLWLEHPEKLQDFHFDKRRFVEAEKDLIRQSRWAIGVETMFGEDPLADFHRQVQVVNAAVPDSPALLDPVSCVLRPGEWTRRVAGTTTPPDPTNLFCVHSVRDDADDNGPLWLHTHGLIRCGGMEWESLGIARDNVHGIGTLLNTVALIHLDKEAPPSGEPFAVGRNLPLVWLPQRQGLRKFPAGLPGGIKDRDPIHSLPSGILLRKTRNWFRRYRDLNAYGPLLDENPIFWLSDKETTRMSAMARERLGEFLRRFQEHGQQTDDWVFLVKLGYRVDGGQSDKDREHLWFQVHAIDGQRVEATLVNEPYDIAAMHDGDRGWHDLSLLTDWTVMSKFGRFGPDEIFLLDKLIQEKAGEAPPAGTSGA